MITITVSLGACFVHHHGQLLILQLTLYGIGKECSNDNSCSSEPNLPWFYHQIPLTVNSDIEARICRDEVFDNEAVLVKELQLYIQ